MTTRAERTRGMPRRSVTVEPRTSRAPFLIGGAVLALVLIAAVAALLLSGTGGVGGVTEPATRPIGIAGEPLAAFTDSASDPARGQVLPTLTGTDLEGNPVTIGPGEGPTAIVVLAHWCHVCQSEVPQIVSFLESTGMPDGVRLVALTTSIQPTAVNYPPSTWLERERWTVPTMIDDGNSRALTALGMDAFPGFIFADADGRVVQRATGSLGATTFGQIVNAIAP